MNVHRSILLSCTILSMHFNTAQALEADTTLGNEDETTMPAREAIKSLAQKAGLVVIFDGRKVEVNTQVEIRADASPKDALDDVLDAMELQLLPVGTNTYAITERTLAPTPVSLSVGSSINAQSFMDTILVTGISAALKQEGHEVSIVEIDEDTIQLLSDARVSDVIFDLPQTLASFSSANTTLYGATAGLNLADLRGLGPERTQVLVNGRRRTPFSGGNGTVYAVDLTTLPHSFVRQVEVLDYSQSVAVGPDAMAGSVNVVLATRTEGIEAGIRYGLSELGDAAQSQTYANWGNTFADERGTFFAAIEYAYEDGLQGGDRSLTAEPYSFAMDGRAVHPPMGEFLPGYGGSTTSETGLIDAILLDDGTRISTLGLLENFALTETGDLERFEWRLDQLYNWAEEQSRILPNERVVGFISAGYELDSSTDLFAELHAGISTTDVTLSPLPATARLGGDPYYGNSIAIDINNPILPDAVTSEILNVTQGRASEVLITQRLVALGVREAQVDREYTEVILGGSREISNSSNLNAHYRYGRTAASLSSRNLANRERLQAALSEADCAQFAGCIPINPFIPGGIEAGADFIRAQPENTEISVNEHEVYIDLSTNHDIGMDLPLSALYGASWRHDEISSRSNTDISENIGNTNVSFADGSSETVEAFARGTLPLLSNDSVLGALRLGSGARLVHTTYTGWTENAEAFLDWSPLDGITLRGVTSYGERPPNLVELYIRDAGNHFSIADPCSGLAVDTEGVVAQNCFSAGPLGVSPGYEQSGALTLTRYYGNRDLDPEISQHWRADLILEPHILFDLENTQSRLRVSYTDSKLKDIVNSNLDDLAECFNSPDLSSPSCGTNSVTGMPLIQRDPATDNIVELGSELINVETRSVKNIDLEVRLSHQPERYNGIDHIWFTALHTALIEVEDNYPESNLVLDRTGAERYPEHNTLVAAGIEIGPHQFALQGRRRGEVQVMNSDLDLARIDPVVTLDLAWRYDLSDHARFTAKVSNVTDELPNRAAFTHGLNVFAEHYDIVGRRYSAEIEFQF